MAFYGSLRNIRRFGNNFWSPFRNFNASQRSISTSPFSFSPIQHVSISPSKETIEVQFKDDLERRHDFPWVFLQDNCTCPKCFHPSSKSRTKLMSDLDLDKKITSVDVNSERNAIKCTWSDGHLSDFSEEWLLDRKFTPENKIKRTRGMRDNPELIGSDYKIERANYDEILVNPKSLLHMLKTLCKNGVYIVEGAAKEVGELEKFVAKFGFFRRDHYGEGFTIKSVKNAQNLAFTSATLCVHTDLPYYSYPPSVQFLHCIKQYYADDAGGTFHLVDGFNVAAQMKEIYPEDYRVLSTVLAEFEDIGEAAIKFHNIEHSPTFVHSPNGQLTRIVYSNQQLSSHLPISVEEVKSLYKSLKLFTNMCYDPKNLMRFKLKEGEIVLFDNWRLLHGREGYDPSKGDRHLQGCYVDWDEIFSSIRALETELKLVPSKQ